MISLLNKAQRDAGLYYVGIFFKDVEIASKTSSRSTKLPLTFGRLIERSLELNDILPNFREEFLFSEGKDYSLFVYYVNNEISIGMIHIGKPNFSLLKVTASDLSRSIRPYLQNIKEIYEEKLKTLPQQKEKPLPRGDLEEEKVKKQPEQVVVDKTFYSNYPEKLEVEKISELESILQSTPEKKEEIVIPSIEDILKDNKTSENVEDVLIKEEPKITTEFKHPSLEELILAPEDYQPSEQVLENFEEFMNKIKVEFIREIGPFGNFLFKKKREEFFKNKAINKFEILKFIQALSEEITIYERRQKFVENARSFLLNT
ncbi:MAG: hypothetical protein N2Z80_03770 [Hydrogenothermaceae bacterium]|nr:hypothetical protein [Hydrogenothermaceae bacterium]